MKYRFLKYEVADGILTLTLNQPEKMNAPGGGINGGTRHSFRGCRQDDNVRVVVVTGAGKSFSAGADLAVGEGRQSYFMDRLQGKEDTEPHRDEGGQLTLKIYEMKKPLFAAINGSAVGIGITMTLPMDIRLASKTAKMGFVFARRGIIFDGCASWFLPRLVQVDVAAEWVYSGAFSCAGSL